MRALTFAGRLALLTTLILSGCGADPDVEAASDSNLTDSEAVPLTLVFVHGVNGDDPSRLSAIDNLKPLEAYITSKFAERAGDLKVTLKTLRVNLYTDANEKLRQPSIDSEGDGTGKATAKTWRSALVSKIKAGLSPTDKNIVLIGHSTGARVSMEIAANVDGSGGDLQDRIAGVVTINGMIDALNKKDYNAAANLSFNTLCRVAQEDGWCDYASNVSGVDAANWVATHKRALGLVSFGDCSPQIWTGWSDKSLPIGAQSAPLVPGLALQPTNGTWRPYHGNLYGEFCHSDITNPNSPRHDGAKRAVGDRILDWLFLRAPRVVNTADLQGFEVPALAANTSSQAVQTTGSCAAGEHDGGFDTVATCKHPGFTDEDDHASDAADLVRKKTGECGVSIQWQHHHAGERHAAQIYTKTYSLPEGGGLVGVLKNQ